jgi:hypothetical protein
MGAGVNTGEYSSFLTNAARLTSNPGGLMQQFSEGFYSVGAQYSFDTAFGPGTGERMKGKDAASFFADVLPDIKAKIDATPQNQTANMLQYSGLGNRGIDLEMANRIRKMPVSEINDISRRLKGDALAMSMPDDATRKLQDFETRLDEAWKTLGTSFENHLVPLLSPLSKLTDNFGRFADAALKEGGAVDVALKEAAGGIESFATKMSDPKFREYVASFAKDAIAAALLVEVVGKAIAIGAAGLSGLGAFSILKGIGSMVPGLALGAAAVGGAKAFADAPGHALGGSGWDAAARLWNGSPGSNAQSPNGSPSSSPAGHAAASQGGKDTSGFSSAPGIPLSAPWRGGNPNGVTVPRASGDAARSRLLNRPGKQSSMGHHPAHIGKADHETVIDISHMAGSYVTTG